MRIRKIGILCLLMGIGLSLHAQTNTKLEVGLKSGEVLYPHTLEYKVPTNATQYLLVDDSLKYRGDQLSYYQGKTGYYRYIPSRDTSRYYRLQRQMQGRVDTYARIIAYPGVEGASPTSRLEGTGYFAKSDGLIQKLNYETVKKTVTGYPEAKMLLKQGEDLKVIRIVGFCIGGALVGAGMLQRVAYYQENPDGDEPGLSPLLVAGVGVAGASALLIIPIKKKPLQALEIYNR